MSEQKITTKVVVGGIVTRVIDGDTFEARVDLGFRVYSIQKFRLMGIDAPEHDDKATEYLKSKILNKIVLIESLKADSFGRWLCNVVIPGQGKTINAQAVEDGFAVEMKK
jgi:micrococcal nuclease